MLHRGDFIGISVAVERHADVETEILNRDVHRTVFLSCDGAIELFAVDFYLARHVETG